MLAPYRDLLGLPGARRLVASSLVGRVPYGMESLAILLFVRDVTGSYAAAGVVTACSAAAVCVGGPVQGRVVDRIGQPPVLLFCGVAHLVLLGVLVLLGLAGAPLGALIACVIAGSALIPPLSPALRTLWPGLVERGRADRRVLDTAYAFEAVAIEILFVIGPLLAAVIIAAFSPAACVMAGGTLALVGSVAFATSAESRAWRPAGGAGGHWIGPLKVPAVLVLVAVAIPHGAAVGLIEFAIPAFAEREGSRAAAGLLIAAWAIGSLAGGLWYGSRQFRGTTRRRLVVLHVALSLTAAPVALAAGYGPVAACLLLAGLPLASAAACLYALLAEVAPAAEVTEANTWLISGILAGIGLGSLVSGILIEESGPSAAFAVSSAVFAVGALVAHLGRRRLAAGAPVPAPAPA